MGGPRGFGLAGLVGIFLIGGGQANFYKCSTRGAYVISLDLASGSGLDYVGTFTCSDGGSVDMKLGTNGNGEYHFESAGLGYVGLRDASWDGDLAVASALAFKRFSDGNYGTPYGSDYFSDLPSHVVPEALCNSGQKIGGFFATAEDSYRGSTMVHAGFMPVCVGDAFVCKNPGAFISSVAIYSNAAVNEIASFTCTDGSLVTVGLGEGGDADVFHSNETGGPFTALMTHRVAYPFDDEGGILAGFQLQRASDGNYGNVYGRNYVLADFSEQKCPGGSYINGLYISMDFLYGTPYIDSDIAPQCACPLISNCVTQNSSDCKCTLCAPVYKIVNNADGTATCTACPVISNCAAYTTDCSKCTKCATSYIVATDPATLTTTCETPATIKTCDAGALITAVTIQAGNGIDRVVSFTCTSSKGTPTEVRVGIGGGGGVSAVATGGPFRGFQNTYYDRASSGACSALSFMSAATSTYGTVFGISSGVPVPKLCPQNQNMVGLSVSSVHYVDLNNANLDLVAQDMAPICSTTTLAPTPAPTSVPSNAPTNAPTSAPTTPVPSKAPTNAPTSSPTNPPTPLPSSGAPTATPTSLTAAPTALCPAGQYKDTTAGTCGSSCSAGFFKDATTSSCLVCGFGGLSYKCPSGKYKNGYACDGTDTSDVQTCNACSSADPNWTCAYGYYKAGDACDGTTTYNADSCVQCVNHGPNYLDPVYQCAVTSGFYMTGLACDGTGTSDTQDCQACSNGGSLKKYACTVPGYSKTGTACTSTSTYDSQTCEAPTPAPSSAPAPSNAPSSSPTNTPSKSPTQVPSTGSIMPVTPVPSATAAPTATSCKAGYYLSGGACAQCSSSTYHCAKYATPAADDSINCKCSGSCKAGYTMNANGYLCDVCSSSIYHCSKYIATTGTDPICQCSGCKSGYGLTGTSCVACTSSHCSTYVTNSCDCTSCKSGYGISGTK